MMKTQVEAEWHPTPPHQRFTAPASSTPSQNQNRRSLGFLKRHLGHRRKSSTGLPNGHLLPTSAASPQTPPHTPPRTPIYSPKPPQPQEVKQPQLSRQEKTAHQSHESSRTVTPTGEHRSTEHKTGNDDTERRASVLSEDNPLSPVKTNETVTTVASSVDAHDNASVNGGAPPPQSPGKASKSGGVRWAPGYEDNTPTRPRRTSSAGASRRISIYMRGAEGSFVEGVDAGVGSKARRLSVHIPDDYELDIDYCRLHDHFNLLARKSKKEIGEGGAAVVKLMQSRTAGADDRSSSDTVFAVKEFRERDASEEAQSDYVRKIKSEYAISKSCGHPNIVKTFRLCTSDNETKWFHVMEYCDLGDLNDLIRRDYFSVEDRNCMFKQLLRGVDYLHSRGIAHRDLKSENLLVTRTGCLKIADFGTAEVFCGRHPGLRNCRRPSLVREDDEVRLCKPGLIGSRPYMAPEILANRDYDPRTVDVWSCAIVYLTLVVGGTPWECASTEVKNYNIYCRSWDEWLERYPDGQILPTRELPSFANTPQFRRLGDGATKRMMMGMLHPDPAHRWSIHDALESNPVPDYPCCQQEGYSEDIRTRQRKALHNHAPPKTSRAPRFLKP